MFLFRNGLLYHRCKSRSRQRNSSSKISSNAKSLTCFPIRLLLSSFLVYTSSILQCKALHVTKSPTLLVCETHSAACFEAGRYPGYISTPTLSKTRNSCCSSSPVETMSLPGEIITAEAKKSQKRKKRRKIERGNAGDDWAKSLSECQLDLLVSVKQLAMERVRSSGEISLNGLLTPAGLRAIGVILEEFMMDRVQTLRDATAAPSSVIDDLRACIQKSDDETNNINQEII